MIGKEVSHYRILEKLGGGGMGVVYKAEDTKLGRFVALKFLSAPLTPGPSPSGRGERFSDLQPSPAGRGWPAGPEEGLRDISTELETTPGMAMGTVQYMSPEQALGREVDARTDIFSFGAVLYEMATGRLPFAGDSPAMLFDAILNRAPVSPLRLNPELSPEEYGRRAASPWARRRLAPTGAPGWRPWGYSAWLYCSRRLSA